MGEPGDEPAHQIEDQVGDRAHAIFDVVPEDPEEQHVAADVEPAPVQEHGVEHRQPDLLVGKVAVRAVQRIGAVARGVVLVAERGRDLLVGQGPPFDHFTRDGGVFVAEGGVVRVGAEGPLDEDEDQDVGRDEQNGDDGKSPRRVVILERDHCVGSVPLRAVHWTRRA